VAAVLAALGGSRLRVGALVGTGLSAVTFGLFAADLAQGTAGHGGVGAGMVLSLLGWLACAAGSVLVLRARPGEGSTASAGGAPVRPRRADVWPITLLALCAVGTAIAFVPSWDSYTLRQASTGATQTATAGYAFDNPGWVIFGNLAAVVALIAVAVAAAMWRPARQGAALLAGAIVAMAAQAISALIQVSEPASPGIFGISPAQAQAGGLTVSSGVTPIFWVYCVFVIALAISCAWMLTAPAYPAGPYPAGAYPVPGFPAQYPGAASAPSGEDVTRRSGEPDAPGSLPAEQDRSEDQAPESSAANESPNEPEPGSDATSTVNEGQAPEGGSGAGIPPRSGAAFLWRPALRDGAARVPHDC